MPKLTRAQIDKVFEDAENQGDYIIGLYELAYGDDWARVKTVMQWPMISKDNNEYIFGLAIEFDKIHHPAVFAGGAWMNNGFSGSDSCSGDDIVLRETVWES